MAHLILRRQRSGLGIRTFSGDLDSEVNGLEKALGAWD